MLLDHPFLHKREVVVIQIPRGHIAIGDVRPHKAVALVAGSDALGFP